MAPNLASQLAKSGAFWLPEIAGIDPRRICYFAVDALSTFTDLINLFQAARMLFPDLGDAPRYFLLDEASLTRASSAMSMRPAAVFAWLLDQGES